MVRTSKVWILKKLFEGEPKLSDFELEEQELRDINDGGKTVTNTNYSSTYNIALWYGCARVFVKYSDNKMICTIQHSYHV